MMKSKWAGIIAGILIVVALGVLSARLRGPDQNLVLDMPEFIGIQLAEQAAALVGEDGGMILLISPDLPGVEDPYVIAYRRGFTQAIGGLARGAQVVEAGVTADPMALQAGKPVFGSRELARLIKEHPDAKVFVSLAGMPEFTRSAVDNWSDSNPRLVVFAPWGGPAQQLIKAGVLHSVIVPREQATLEDDEVIDGSIKARFDQEYEILSR